jgi:Tol biopolymer transport system component
VYLFLSRPIASADVVWLSILPPPGGFDLSPDPVISPNGRHVIYKAQDASHRTHVWIKSLGSPDAHPIPGTDGTDFTAAAFWSPDSRSLGFFREGKLNRVDIDGASPQVLAAAPEPRGGTWSSSGVIIFNADIQSLMRVPASGGAATRIADASDGGVRLFPHALPDGNRYLFTSRNAGGQGMGVYIGSLSSPDVRRVSDTWSPAVYANGYLLFARQRGLFAQRFDVDRQQTLAEPQPIADGVGIGYGTPLSFAFFAAAGVVTYWGGLVSPTTQLTWFDRTGKRLSVATEPGLNIGFSVTPDGRRAALERGVDTWILNLQSGAGDARLTADGRFTVPVLTPSGDHLALMERGRGIVTMPVAGGATKVIVAGAPSRWPVAWSRDGRVLTFLDSTPTGWRIWTVTDRDGSPPALDREAPFILGAPDISPDGSWLAYSSNESGRQEVYVDSFPVPSTRSRVSMNGGNWPKWRSD